MEKRVAVNARGLAKRYVQGGKEKPLVVALEGVSFEVEKGEIFGFLGPDGAGKTTLFRILTTLLLPDEGEATIEGYDIQRDYSLIRESIGYMPGKFALYTDLTVAENLKLFASIFKTSVEANYDLIKDIYEQIAPFKNRRAGNLSGGMKQKLGLSCALIHRPKLLILDEPTTGVDAVSRKEFWEMLKKLRNGGLTILVSTPYMDEAAQCDRVALMQEGKILSLDTPDGIVQQFSRPIWAVKTNRMFDALQDLREYPFTHSCFAFGESHHLVLKDERKGAKDIHGFLIERGHREILVERIRAGIEDTFMDLMLRQNGTA
jgi:ABC-2 type transport system ATP-binding protein